jgi:hypothetical protein
LEGDDDDRRKEEEVEPQLQPRPQQVVLRLKLPLQVVVQKKETRLFARSSLSSTSRQHQEEAKEEALLPHLLLAVRKNMLTESVTVGCCSQIGVHHQKSQSWQQRLW